MAMTQIKRPDAEEVKRAAYGRWHEIFRALDPNLSNAIENLGKHVPRPHLGGRDGFLLPKNSNLDGRSWDNQLGYLGDGYATLCYSTGKSFFEVLSSIIDYLGMDQFSGPLVEMRKNVPLTIVHKTGDPAKIKKLWNRSHKPRRDDPMTKYLMRRGIPFDLIQLQTEIRASSKIYTIQNDDFVHYPGMLGRVYDAENRVVTNHRTFLNSDGLKAFSGDQAKKIQEVPDGLSLMGSAIRLTGSPVEGYLAIAEGIETALSVSTGVRVHDQHYLPCWSVINTNGVVSFEPPSDVHTVLVFADKDQIDPVKGVPPGQYAAHQLKIKLEAQGIRVIRILPKLKIPEGQKSVDWNDVLLADGQFPTWDQIIHA